VVRPVVHLNEKAFESLNVLFGMVAFALEEAANLSLTHFEDPISAVFFAHSRYFLRQ